MKRTTLRIVCAIAMTFLSIAQHGCCYKLRNSTFVTVNDIGDHLSTKYCYNPAIVEEEVLLSKIFGYSRFDEGLVKLYPQVF